MMVKKQLNCVRWGLLVISILTSSHASATIITKVKYLGIVKEIGTTVVDLLELFDGAPFGKAQLKVSASDTVFNLGFIGTGFALDHTGSFSGITSERRSIGGGNMATVDLWEWSFNIFEDAGFFSDGLTINGFLEHVVNPRDHDIDTLPAPMLDFGVMVEAGNAVNTPSGLKVTASDAPKEDTHPPKHIDRLTKADINANVKRRGVVIIESDISGYTFSLSAQHIPEPRTFLLLCIGLLGLIIVRRKNTKITVSVRPIAHSPN
ncbi:MAG: PEP-CTERM sorting domain-containing protein [Colwellia sp.]|nr:PEP-CTERM sorting domain-containing protein [Colwellia sp.]